MSPTVTGLEVIDVRFPTSEELDGSDAMNPDPDYSAAYVVLRTHDRQGKRCRRRHPVAPTLRAGAHRQQRDG
jgi:hypothetical protein